MTGIRDEKVVAGLSCGDVLAQLSDYLDGDLTPGDRARVEEHLRGCEGCTRFGGEFRSTVQALRRHLSRGDLPAALRRRIAEEIPG